MRRREDVRAIRALMRLLLIGIALIIVARLLRVYGVLDGALSLASLKTVDDYPLYKMRFYGSYGLSARLGGAPRLSGSQASGKKAEPWACTAFSARNGQSQPLFARNFDWSTDQALLLYTDPPGAYASVSLVDISFLGYGVQKPSWLNRVWLLQAPFIPFDGMNEHGLAVGVLAVPTAEPARDSTKLTLNTLLMIRVLLDYARNVEEALELMGRYNLTMMGGPPVHYMLADAAGDSAVVEYVRQEMRVIRGDGPYQVATNFVLSGTLPTDPQAACWRYRLANEALRASGGVLSKRDALDLLGDTSQRNTIWSAVYNLTTGEFLVVMGRRYDRPRPFKLTMSAR